MMGEAGPPGRLECRRSVNMAGALRTTSRVIPLLVIAAAATAAAPTRVPGDRFEPAAALSRSVAVLDASGTRQLPFGGFTLRQPGRAEWVVVAAYLMFREVTDGDTRRRESYWVARRIDGSDLPKAHMVPEIRWASSDTCPDLDAAVRSMGEVVQDRIEIAVPGDGDASESPVASARYGLWSDEGGFRGTSFAASVRVTAMAGSPLGLWVDAKLAALAACWSEAPPPTATIAAP